ncbi:unnamed protein product [Calypogeia fissa]
MPTYKIAGINVNFPYKAYDCQLVYMERVIHALQQGCNALLESPTGTGKTLCLLCAALAWRNSLKPGLEEKEGRDPSSQNDPFSSPEVTKNKKPTILYASRTHSQLQQVIRELKATSYRPKMTVLGSREQMCINPDVQSMRGRVQNHACRTLVKGRKCHHHNRVPDYMKSHPGLGDEPVDIEDLVSIGKKHGPCPYYLSRELHNTADIVFLPYNYLIDKDNRRSLTGINWEKTVIIFDEAHNLEGLCADAASFDLPANHLTACIGEAKQCVEIALQQRSMNNGADTSIDPDNFAVLKALLLELEKKIYEIPIDSGELGFTRSGAYIYEFLAAMKITWETATVLIDTIDQATTLLEDEAATGLGGPGKSSGANYRLLSLSNALKLIFRGSETSHASYYKMHVHEVRNKDGEKGARRGTVSKVTRTLSWWCFNPGIAMEEFAKMGVRSVILTSGTLAPLDSFACELKLPFKVRLENPHVIESSQIWVGVVPSGPSGRPLNSSYKTRDSPEYKQELGNTIVNFARIVPDGLLVFFPSYHLLNSCIDAWQSLPPGSTVNSSSIWERICKFKQPVVEPRESALFNQANESFMEKLSDMSSSGAVFFAVCRGKVSEGLDFADKAGRAVVVTGIPYAMKTDPKIRLKREYLDEAFQSNANGKKGIRGEEWYVQQASRAVNQAVGRVIRHRNDYGAIILCDERFAKHNSQSQMSLWLRPHIKCYSKFGDAAFTLTRFFRDKGGVVVVPKSAPQQLQSSYQKGGATGNSSLSIFHKDVKSVGVNITYQRQDTGDILRLKRSLPMQHFAGPSASSVPLSEMLATRRAQTTNQFLSSMSIIQANCAVGSTTGFVTESRNGASSIQVQDGLKSSAYDTTQSSGVTGIVSQILPNSKSATMISANGGEGGKIKESSTTLACDGKSCNPSRKRRPDPFEKPWSLSKHVATEDKVLNKSAESSKALEGHCRDTLNTRMDDNKSKRESTHSSVTNRRVEGESGEQVAKCCSKEGNDCIPSTVGKVKREHETDTKKGEVKALASAGNEERSKQFKNEVKAHLSTVEFKRFIACMNDVREKKLNFQSFLKTVSNLFAAPERLFLLKRLGGFIPNGFKQHYEVCLAERCAELEHPSDNDNGQAEYGESSLKPCLTSKSRKSEANKKQYI